MTCMKGIEYRAASGPIAGILVAACLSLCAGTAGAQPSLASDAVFTATTPQFCAEVQRRVAGTQQPLRNVMHDEFQSFVKSKPSVKPLEPQQYVEYADASRTQPQRISCKLKTADHINAVYGNGAAATQENDNACREINRTTILAVFRALDPGTRGRLAVPPHRFMLDGDENRIMGSGWIEPYPFVYAGMDGAVHVHAKALFVLWDDWRWQLAPDKFRGTHYCHLIAPEYARALMTGEVSAPAAGGS
jgi:hypothetical protein